MFLSYTGKISSCLLTTEGKIMKAIVWIIIVAALVFGGYRLYKSMSAKTEVKPTTKTEATATTAPETRPATETTSKPNSEKGIQNWRAIKKVRNLSDQHNKDLENNM